MKKSLMLLTLLCLALLIQATPQDVYVIELEYNGTSLESKNIYVTRANYTESNEASEYIAKIISFNNETLYTKMFNVAEGYVFSADPDWFDEQGNQIVIPESTEIREPINRQLLLPYFEHGKEIIVEKNREKVLTISIVQFAKTCGDDVCQENENTLTCEIDCPSQVEVEEAQPLPKFPYAIAVAGIIVIAITSIVYLLLVKKK